MSDINRNKIDIEPSAEFFDDEGLDFSMYIGMFIENRYLIGSITVALFIISIFYAQLTTPIYSADALLQVQGKGSSIPIVESLAALMGTKESSTGTEVEILKSRKVIGGVIDKFNQTIRVYPKRFSYIGRYYAREFEKDNPGIVSDPVFGLSSFGWGGESIQVSRFDVPRKFISKIFVITAVDDNTYELISPDDEVILKGRIGVSASSDDGSINIFIVRLKARSGTDFQISKLSRAGLIIQMQNKINIEVKGGGSGILSVSMTGNNRSVIEQTIHEITLSYLRHNVERHSEESKKMLDFISSQLPQLRANLNAAEQALNMYRERKGIIYLSSAIQNLIQRVSNLETKMSSLKLKRVELSHSLTEDHPTLLGIDDKILTLNDIKEELNKKLQLLPEKERQTVRLTRDVSVSNELYMLLLNKAQELSVSKAGVIGSARIIDVAVSGENPIRPNKKLIVTLGIILGFITGVMAAVIKSAMNRTVLDPGLIEKNLSYPVYAEIPFSSKQSESDKVNNKKGVGVIELMAYTNNDEQLVESMRSLRTSIQFALIESEGNVVSISGPVPDTGKSFVSANLSYVIAESEKKVLLVDADLRRGHLSKYFNLDKSPGLSDILSGSSSYEAVVNKRAYHQNLDVITTGVYPPNPSELFLSDKFLAFIDKVKQIYDIVLIDTPPVLSVTDAAIVGRYASANFMLVRSGRHYMREINDAFKRFEQNGVRMKGVIFNGVDLVKRGYGYGYGYGYSYKRYQYSYK